jgi:hypothetical protein
MGSSHHEPVQSFARLSRNTRRKGTRRAPSITPGLRDGHGAARHSSLLARLIATSELALAVITTDIYVISLIILHWTVIFTVGIAAVIVMVMKGPAYVADPYPLQDTDSPDASPTWPHHGH